MLDKNKTQWNIVDYWQSFETPENQSTIVFSTMFTQLSIKLFFIKKYKL